MPNVRTYRGVCANPAGLLREYNPGSMPWPLAALAYAVNPARNPALTPSQVLDTANWHDILIQSRHYRIDPSSVGGPTITYDEGVQLTYGVTKVLSDTLEVNLQTNSAKAKGHVRLSDPDATINADELDFCWALGHESGKLSNFDASMSGFRIRGENADLTKAQIVLTNAEVRASRPFANFYRIRSRRMTLVAGKFARLERPYFRFLGIDLPYHPTTYLSLDPRENGVGLPAFAYKNGYVGLNYGPTFLIGDQDALAVFGSVYHGSLPHYGYQIAHTFLDPDVKDQAKILPGTDLDTRFGYGYFDNVGVLSPEADLRSARQLRDSVGLGTDVNQGTGDRIPGGSVTDALDAVYQTGGPLGAFGYVNHVRFQVVREQGETAFTNRIVADTRLAAPSLRINPWTEAVARFDTQGFAGGRDYLWDRTELGLVVSPVHQLTLSAAYLAAGSMGTPDLTTDKLYNFGGWSFRGDARIGGLTGSYLVRYFLNGHMFDDEYRISEIVGSLKFEVLYRRFPSDFRVGVTMRLDEMIDNFRHHHAPLFQSAGSVPLVPAP